MMHHKHGNGTTVTLYGTEGHGVRFIGNKSTMATSEHGMAAIRLFKSFMEGKKAIDLW